MDYLLSLILGLVQGITEGLPVSPAGHLALAEAVLGNEAAPLFLLACGHLGAMAAAAGILGKDLRMLVYEAFRFLGIGLKKTTYAMSGREDPVLARGGGTYRRVAEIGLISLPVSLIWMIASERLMGGRFPGLLFTAWAFLVSGIALLVVSRIEGETRAVHDLPGTSGLLCGLALGSLLVPGISSVALTLVVLQAYGCAKKAAVRVSYVIALVPAFVFFAASLQGAMARGSFGPGVLIAGILRAGGSYLTARFLMRRLLRFVISRRTDLFAYYSFAAAIAALAVHFLAA